MLAIYSSIKYSKKGFSLIEIMIVIALAAVAIVGFLAYKPAKKVSLHDAIEQINAVTQQACAQALLTQKMQQMRFFFDDDMHITYIGYAAVHDIEKVSSESIPANSKIKITVPCKATNLSIGGGENELSKSRIRETYVLIYPEGYTQEVELGIQSPNQDLFIMLELNPFLGAFQMKDLAS